MPKVLLIADEAARREAIDALSELGATVESMRLDADPVAKVQVSGPPDVVLVDADERVDRGLYVVRACKGSELLHQVPVIIAFPPTRLAVLDASAGADDFILKPILAAELYARLRAAEWRSTQGEGTTLLKSDDLVLNLAGWEALLFGRHIPFTKQEFGLLRFLLQHRGRAFSRQQLLRQVWGYRHGGATRTVDIHVRRLRAKLGARYAERIQTVRGVGYKYV